VSFRPAGHPEGAPRGAPVAPRRTRRLPTAAFAAVGGSMALGAALALAGCSSGGPSAARSTTTSSAASSTTSSSSAATTTTPGASTTATTGTTTCQVGQLRISPQQSNGAAGTIEVTMTLLNVSNSTCVLDGYPGMLLLDAGGHPLPTNVVRGGATFAVATANQPPATVVLAPQQAAAFVIHYSDVPVGTEDGCPTSAQAQVTPPNDFDHAVVALQIAPCGGGTIHVSPVYPA
jgi:hypothetical protein